MRLRPLLLTLLLLAPADDLLAALFPGLSQEAEVAEGADDLPSTFSNTSHRLRGRQPADGDSRASLPTPALVPARSAESCARGTSTGPSLYALMSLRR